MEKTLKLFTLFSGYESQMMALEVATRNSTLKAELVGWSEINTIVQAVHNAAYPEYADRCYPDVTKINWDEVGDIDILFASSPCQDVSRAGVRKGMQKDSETRSSLVWEVEKAIAIKRPKWFIEENVEGMLEYRADFESLVRSIGSYGYACFSGYSKAAITATRRIALDYSLWLSASTKANPTRHLSGPILWNCNPSPETTCQTMSTTGTILR